MRKILLLVILFCLQICKAQTLYSTTIEETGNAQSTSASVSYYGYVFNNGSGIMARFTVLLVANNTVLTSAETDDTGFFTISTSYTGNYPVELCFPG